MTNTENPPMTRKEWDKIVLKRRKSGFKSDYSKIKPARVTSFSMIALAMWGNRMAV